MLAVTVALAAAEPAFGEPAAVAGAEAAAPVAAPPAPPPAASAPPAASEPAPAEPSAPSAVPAPPPAAAAPPSATPSPPPPAMASRPSRRIDDLNRPLMGGVPQGRYEAGVAGAFAASENLQGPLDGAWFVTTADGRRLFRFQFDDPGYRGGRIEGAWRDLRAGPGVIEAGGFFTGVVRDGGKVVVRLTPGDGQPAVLTLEPKPGGVYGGQMAAGPQILPVTMARP